MPDETQALPLTGLTVISVEVYGAGPFCTQYLATFGADVIKIESRKLGGDVARVTGPNSLGPEDSLYFQSFNQGKRSLSLDLKHEKGQEVLHRLVEKADVVANNLRGTNPRNLASPMMPSNPSTRRLSASIFQLTDATTNAPRGRGTTTSCKQRRGGWT